METLKRNCDLSAVNEKLIFGSDVLEHLISLLSELTDDVHTVFRDIFKTGKRAKQNNEETWSTTVS